MYGPDEADSGEGRESARVEPAGMGASPSGPEFLPASPPPSEPPPSLVTTDAWRAETARHRHWPGVLSVSLIVVVALVVLVASAVARYRDTHVVAPPPVVPTVRADPPNHGEIEFTTPDGNGRLILLSRSWQETGREQPVNGTYLLVEVKIVCTGGRLGYDPYNFQAFDHTGGLFDVAEAGASRQVLGVGQLSEGQSTRGFLAFDLPRGEVTLLMSDDSDQSITALKIPA